MILMPFIRMALRIASYVLFLLTLVSAYGGYVSPAIWAFPSMLVLAFPYLLITTVVVALAWLLARRIITATIGGVVVFACLPIAGSACPLGFSTRPEPSDRTFTLMTYNVFDGRDAEHPDAPFIWSPSLDYVLHSGADIVCLQELYSLPRHSPETRAQSDSIRAAYPYIYDGREDNAPLTILSKYPLRPLALPADDRNAAAICDININGLHVWVVDVHLTSYQLSDADREVVTDIRGPRSARRSIDAFRDNVAHKLTRGFRQRAEIAVRLRDIIDSLDGPVIVCGDFNDVPGSYAYRKIKGADLADACAQTRLGPNPTYNQHLFYFHIDQILYRGPLKALAVKKGSLKASDHYPQTATFKITD